MDSKQMYGYVNHKNIFEGKPSKPFGSDKDEP